MCFETILSRKYILYSIFLILGYGVGNVILIFGDIKSNLVYL
jgi:hypothetical protein